MNGPLFRDGQAVVCINDEWQQKEENLPRKGEVYHVTASIEVDDCWCILLIEYPRRGRMRYAFPQTHFAPVENDELEAEADAAVLELWREVVEEGALVG